MKSTSETGHAKNAGNFKQLIAFCEQYGVAYNPSHIDITMDNLRAAQANTLTALDEVDKARKVYDAATIARRDVFANLKSFSSQVANILAASGVSKLVVADARGILRKLNGRRSGSIKAPATTGTATTEAAEDKHISVSQLSIDNQIAHFSSLINLVAQHPGYNPNEPDFAITGLQAKLDKLNAANDTVIKAIATISAARQQRNLVMYHPISGLAHLAAGVKLYVKGIFGASSAQYKNVAGLKFNTAY
jgi:hypothetical protein